jgi:hypothetical protein
MKHSLYRLRDRMNVRRRFPHVNQVLSTMSLATNVLVRPHRGAGWRIDFPRVTGTFTVVVASQRQAIQLAERMRPDAEIRLVSALDGVKSPSF